MERKPPKTILQLKSGRYHVTPFCIKLQTNRPPEQYSGTAFYLSMNDECHIRKCIITFRIFVRHRVRLVGSGTGRLELY